MPRIRKKTSKRGQTHQREKIKHKAAETRKKRKRDAKKNPQWKSKLKKDPGIPNNFPFKDQILAEVAEQRRQAEEAKKLKREQKKALRAGNAEVEEAEEEDGSDGEDDVMNAFNGVTAVRGAAAGGSKQAKAKIAADEMEVDEELEVVESELLSLQAVLEEADVVVEVLDARDPLAYHSSHLAELVKAKQGQKILLVLNKIDSTPREAVSSWSTYLRSQHPTLLFRSASAFLPVIEPVVPSKEKGKARADDALGLDSVLTLLGQWAQEKAGEKPLTVAIVGGTNAGKSSFVDSLLRNAALPIYKLGSPNESPTTTMSAQEVSLEVASKTIRIIDTPGYAWIPRSEQAADEVEASRAKDILVRNRGRIERLKDPEPVVHQIVSRANQDELILFYNLPAFADKDTEAFLRALARANGLIKKGGVVDVTGASRIILRDWSTGKFPRYTVSASTSNDASQDGPLAELYAADEKILSALLSRKEWRQGTGLVKLSPSEVDTRQLALETVWVPSGEDSEDDDAQNETEDVEMGASEEGESDGAEEDEEDEEDEDDEEEEEEPEELVSLNKRKRVAAKQPTPSSRPTKKVAFSAEPQSTKQARKAAGARGSAVKAKPEAVKSALKSKPPKAQPTPKAASAKKAANAPSKKSAVPTSTGSDEAYDFKKFF
ncbi:hypothetical protein BDW22DRAFT_1480687 [Trametopsis cervina]|nr:hypothetical protein BDW22DRAFT_1480687 [Trametopsis cervina]